MDEPQKSKRGGPRPNSGRPRKSASPTALTDTEIKAMLACPAPSDIDVLAAKHSEKALTILAAEMLHGSKDGDKLDASIAVLDRGWGKPTPLGGGEQMLLFMGPSRVRPDANAVQDEARAYGLLALAVIEKIASGGSSAAVRIRAAKALLDRGLGLAPPARLPGSRDMLPSRQLGKKEQANAAAAEATSGIYAPRSRDATAH